MEWMWAAMGADTAAPGATNTTGYTKAFAGSTGSNAIGDYAVFGYGTSEAGATTMEHSNPPGSKLPNELGLYDMSGNVWEWTWDLGDNWPAGGVTDYHGPTSGNYREAHGGFWNNPSEFCTVAIRFNFPPYYEDYGVGFRVIRN
jgi:formylglycine-generating enzyme required for sulfatase activity